MSDGWDNRLLACAALLEAAFGLGSGAWIEAGCHQFPLIKENAADDRGPISRGCGIGDGNDDIPLQIPDGPDTVM